MILGLGESFGVESESDLAFGGDLEGVRCEEGAAQVCGLLPSSISSCRAIEEFISIVFGIVAQTLVYLDGNGLRVSQFADRRSCGPVWMSRRARSTSLSF